MHLTVVFFLYIIGPFEFCDCSCWHVVHSDIGQDLSESLVRQGSVWMSFSQHDFSYRDHFLCVLWGLFPIPIVMSNNCKHMMRVGRVLVTFGPPFFVAVERNGIVVSRITGKSSFPCNRT